MNIIILISLIIAVVVWLSISLILVISREAKRTGFRSQVAAAAETDESEMTDASEQLRLTGAPTWEKRLAELSGLTGWVMLETNGDIIESSNEQFESIGASLSKLLGWIHENTGSLGCEPLQLLELDAENGSIIILFPQQKEETARLVLFLDTEMYKNQIRETLSNLNWESNLKGVEPG